VTLQPYDGATRVRLPDGTECWEKETKRFGGSEVTLSYRYSVDVSTFQKDYWGRVKGLKVQAPDLSWNDPVHFFSANPNVIDRVQTALQTGWADLSEVTPGGQRIMRANNYLKIANDVVALLETMKKP
jgi:hypothetical protein